MFNTLSLLSWLDPKESLPDEKHHRPSRGTTLREQATAVLSVYPVVSSQSNPNKINTVVPST